MITLILNKLNYPIYSLKGIGSNYHKIFTKIGIHSVGNLLEYFPRNFSDRTKIVSLKEACNLDSATIKAQVMDHRMVGKKYRQFLKVIIFDGTYYGSLVCFNRNFLKNTLIINKNFYITGKFYFNYGEIQSSNFEFEEATEEYKGRILPIYPLTEGLNQNILRKSIEDSIKKYRLDIEDELPAWCIKKRGLLLKRDAVKSIHFPQDFVVYAKAKKTFIYEEFFFQKLFLLKRKESNEKIKKHRSKISFKLKEKFLKHLPFCLTDYQNKALSEIEKDIFSDHVFSRLLQGDVGAGKTIVALIAMLSVVEAGYQSALMVPTEVLATQHYRVIKEITSCLKINIAFLTGSLKKVEKDNILQGLKSGELQIAIGTHSLFSDDVVYNNLGFVVIDEQQRFGVEQRYQLLSKGDEVDLLLMTATPIPRSLAMSLYGDLELTMMKGIIQGRKAVKTWLIDDNTSRIKKMTDWIKSLLSKEQGRAIFVYSLIENSQKKNDKDLYNEYEKLSNIFKSFGTGFIHSRISAEEKEKIMNNFHSGKIKILAATTVVEVGIDIPDANIIVIENAENYGLSTLHQLRGRVGRNNKQAYMILITKLNELTEIGKKRLELMTKENDGFKIAEEDLLLRGPGDFLGSRQSGLPEYKFADIRKDMEILKQSSEDAGILFKMDSDLNKHEHLNTRISFLHRLKSYCNNSQGLVLAQK